MLVVPESKASYCFINKIIGLLFVRFAFVFCYLFISLMQYHKTKNDIASHRTGITRGKKALLKCNFSKGVIEFAAQVRKLEAKSQYQYLALLQFFNFFALLE